MSLSTLAPEARHRARLRHAYRQAMLHATDEEARTLVDLVDLVTAQRITPLAALDAVSALRRTQQQAA